MVARQKKTTNLGKKQISWVRTLSKNILTIGWPIPKEIGSDAVPSTTMIWIKLGHPPLTCDFYRWENLPSFFKISPPMLHFLVLLLSICVRLKLHNQHPLMISDGEGCDLSILQSWIIPEVFSSFSDQDCQRDSTAAETFDATDFVPLGDICPTFISK